MYACIRAYVCVCVHARVCVCVFVMYMLEARYKRVSMKQKHCGKYSLCSGNPDNFIWLFGGAHMRH